MNRVARIHVARGLAGLLFILFGAVTWLSTIAAQAAIEPDASRATIDRSRMVFVTQNPAPALQPALPVIEPQGTVERLAAAPWSTLFEARDVGLDGRGNLDVSDGSGVYRVHAPVAATATPIWLLLVYGLIAMGVGVTLVKARRGRPA